MLIHLSQVYDDSPPATFSSLSLLGVEACQLSHKQFFRILRAYSACNVQTPWEVNKKERRFEQRDSYASVFGRISATPFITSAQQPGQVAVTCVPPDFACLSSSRVFLCSFNCTATKHKHEQNKQRSSSPTKPKHEQNKQRSASHPESLAQICLFSSFMLSHTLDHKSTLPCSPTWKSSWFPTASLVRATHAVSSRFGILRGLFPSHFTPS